MKKILFVFAIFSAALFSFASCQKEDLSDAVLKVYIEEQPDAVLSEVKADVAGCSLNLCVEADFDYSVDLSGVFAQQWVKVGERRYDAQKACDVIPVEVAAAENPSQERSATIRISGDKVAQSVCVTICQGIDLFRRGLTMSYHNWQTRQFAAGDTFELVLDNPNESEQLKGTGVTVDCELVLPSDPWSAVKEYNNNHYADCELLPENMYSLSSSVSASGRKLSLQVNIDRELIRAKDRSKPFVLPLKVEAAQGLYESEVFYLSVPTYASETVEFTELTPDCVINLNGYTVEPNGTKRLNQLIIFNAKPGNDKAVVFCPGGGYSALHASKANIEYLLGTNTTVAVLLYRLPCKQWQGRYEFPVEDAVNSLHMLKENKEEWGGYYIYGISGRSAGGHLAGATAAHYKELVDFQILLYPVITMEPGKTHGSSGKMFLGENPSQTLIDQWSVHKLVGYDTPRTFLAYATNDGTVNPEYNGAMMKLHLEKYANPKINHFVKIYSYGGHSSSSWSDFPECVHEWMNKF